MSLKPCPIQPIPEETARVARAAFPKGSIYPELFIKKYIDKYNRLNIL